MDSQKETVFMYMFARFDNDADPGGKRWNNSV
jgi:hypothetical protein